MGRTRHRSEYLLNAYALGKHFDRWDDLLDAPREGVVSLIRSSGLSERKADSIFGALSALKEKFGFCTLEPVADLPDEELEEFLCSLPEISRKSAYCVMMYGFGRKVFPVDTHVGRVLSRIGPYRELGLDLGGLDHKKLQAKLADIVPPNLRYSLHVNLLVHGREVCRAESPSCSDCELRKFCSQYRSTEARKAEDAGNPTIVDLFCGSGGSSEGFRQAGFRTLLAADRDAGALKTYRLNHPEVPESRLYCGDLSELSIEDYAALVGAERVDVLIGSPPCQGFSHVGDRSRRSDKPGYSLKEDERNFLFECMVRAAIALRPRVFLLENVPGMQSARNQNLSYLEMAAGSLEKEAGYSTQVWRLNAVAFGVPQDRVRYFLVGVLAGQVPSPPREDYLDAGKKGHAGDDALPPVGVGEAIFDLPPCPAGGGAVVGKWVDRGLDDPRRRRYLGKFGITDGTSLIFNHTVRYHNDRDLELYSILRQGEDSVHAVVRHGRADLMKYRKDVFDDKYAKLRADKPSKTIVSHLAKDGNGYIHPSEVRSISLREAARLQSFPDDYVFCGSPSDQWIQVGNAVPPVLALAVARRLRVYLQREGKN